MVKGRWSSNSLVVARDLAEKAGVPIVPGTKGLVENADEAAQESERLGFPVMLKGISSFNILDRHQIVS